MLRRYVASLLVMRDRWQAAAVACVVLLLLWLVWPSSSVRESTSSAGAAGLGDQFRDELSRVAAELKRQRRQDLTRVIELRTQALRQLEAEVTALKAQVDPGKDARDVADALADRKPVQLFPHLTIPRLIHMTWKSKLQLPYYGTTNVARWRTLNPHHHVVLYDDDDVHTFVLKHFAEFSPYWDTLKPVQKADVFRYVVMWKLGGVYADMDVEPVVPVDAWVINSTSTFEWRTVNVVLGWEQVTDRPDWREFYASQAQLCQWTLMAAPGHPLYRAVLDAVLRMFATGNPEASVIRSTGPGIFSDAVKGFVRKTHGAELGTAPLSLKLLKKRAVHVGDILLLTTQAFAEEGWGAESEERVLVRHSFAGTWKTKAPKDGGGPEALEALDSEAGRLRAQMDEMRRRYEAMRTQMEAEKSAMEDKIVAMRMKHRKKLLLQPDGEPDPGELPTGQEAGATARPQARHKRGVVWSDGRRRPRPIGMGGLGVLKRQQRRNLWLQSHAGGGGGGGEADARSLRARLRPQREEEEQERTIPALGAAFVVAAAADAPMSSDMTSNDTTSMDTTTTGDSATTVPHDKQEMHH